jgi:hypothetical protein
MQMSHSFAHRIARALRRYRRDESGTASSELVLVVWLLSIPVLWITDVTYYVYQRMEVGTATQAAAQAIWSTCNATSMMPATVKCSGMATARDAAVASTSLGTNVSVTSTTEDYYCLVGSPATLYGLVAHSKMSSLTATKPANCAANGIGGSSTDSPGDYVYVTTTFTFTPIFPGFSLVTMFGLPSTLTETVWTRIA